MAYFADCEYILMYPEEEICYSPSYEMYYRLSEHLSDEEVKLLTFLLATHLDHGAASKIRSGRDLFLAMEEQNMSPEDVLRRVAQVLRSIRRYDVLPHLYTTLDHKVAVDPLEDYVKATESKKQTDSTEPCRKKRKTSHQPTGPASEPVNEDNNPPVPKPTEIRKNLTCDVRLRVRAEYCSHETVLNGNVQSNRNDVMEQQFERFAMASNILRARDLGYIVCDIKFSEVTYLDAFWRDYLNGSLLEALKGVFITEPLKQAVGDEAIKLLVHVDEDDYEQGRLILMQNLCL